MTGAGLVTFLVGVALTAIITLPFWLRARRRDRDSAAWEEQATAAGLGEPVSLHPVVDPNRCIGAGACVDICPEHVLAFRDGQGFAVAAARCVGHGLCERACPMEAIQLVFGTETRGVELPRIREDFETNVPGLYIIGELGGMGLIANAFEQAAQCIDGISRRIEADGKKAGGKKAAGNGAGHSAGSPGAQDRVLDLAIVGCGPAGLAASLHALDRGLDFETFEKAEDVGGAVRSYPRRKLVMTREVEVPGFRRLRFREIHKEALIELWEEIVETTGLAVRTGERIAGVDRDDDGTFTLATGSGPVRARRVVLAVGRRGTPRKLGVPGEDAPHVAYSMREPEAYAGLDTLVVGGGDSAIEAALSLAEVGCRVTVSYRRDSFRRAKAGNLERIQAALADGRVAVAWSSEVEEIRPDGVVLRDGTGRRTLPAEAVFVFIGGELPTRFLREAGVQIDVKFGAP